MQIADFRKFLIEKYKQKMSLRDGAQGSMTGARKI